MTLLEQAKSRLTEYGVFTRPIPEFMKGLVQTVPIESIPDKMKLTIAVSELVLFTSQFRRNIQHWNRSLIPINAITFCIINSGAGKDSSVSGIRKNFLPAYEEINKTRKQLAVKRAIEEAIEDGVALSASDDPKIYGKYYTEPSPLFVAPSTNEGYISYLNGLDQDNLGAGYIYSGEFASELSTSPVIVSNLQLLSEVYDEGKKEVKMIKSKENQSKPIHNLPVSAMFVSSPDLVIYDDSIKRKFKNEFTSKLARRSFFCYSTKQPSRQDLSIDDLLASRQVNEDKAVELVAQFSEALVDVTKFNLEKRGKSLSVSKQVRDLYTLYQVYNQELAETFRHQYQMSKLVRTHLHWKAFKLSGALALLRMRDEIELNDYLDAIAITETLDMDMRDFEQDLIKEPYELFSDMINENLVDGKFSITIHQLKKLGYIGPNIEHSMKQLVQFSSSYDLSGVYKITESGIEYTKIVKTNTIGISYKAVKGSKEDRAKMCADGFEFVVTDFKSLADMLKKDYAYSPYQFKDGKRKKENIIGGTKWIALDIDQSTFTDSEMHSIMSEINHHIVRTSNAKDAHKYRVLLELDSYVDLTESQYKKFTQSIASLIGVKADVLPKSQIYYSYSNRTVLSTTDKHPIEVRDHLMVVYNDDKVETIETSHLSEKQKQTLLADKQGTFHYAFEAPEGQGSIALYKAAKHARDLGLDKEQIIELVYEINNYWDEPMEQKRLDSTIISQINKWS